MASRMNSAASPVTRTRVGIITAFTYVPLLAIALRPAPRAMSDQAAAARQTQNPATYRYFATRESVGAEARRAVAGRASLSECLAADPLALVALGVPAGAGDAVV